MPNLTQVCLGLLTFCLLAIQVMAFGSWYKKVVHYRSNILSANICLVLASGLCLVGIEVLILGYLNCLTLEATYIPTAAAAFYLLKTRKLCLRVTKLVFRRMLQSACAEPILFSLCLLMGTLIILSGLRMPFQGDELEYHLASPYLWASKGHWIASPFRLSNGAAFAEVLYTFSAMFHSYVAAHWTHTLFLLVMILGGAALSMKCAGAPMAVAAGILSCPVITNQSSISFNDIASAALLVAGYCALFCESRPSGSGPGKSAKLMALIVLCGAISVKPFTGVAIIPAILYCIKPFRLNKLVLIGLYLVPFVIVSGLWSLRTYGLTGSFNAYKNDPIIITRRADDPDILSGRAAARIPTITELLILPAVPALTSIIGQSEPYGGRTGLVLIPFAIIALWNLKRVSPEHRKNLLWYFASALWYFFIVAPVFIKTRFHIFVWAMLICVASAGYAWARTGPNTGRHKFATVLFYCLALLGMLDSARVLATVPPANAGKVPFSES